MISDDVFAKQLAQLAETVEASFAKYGSSIESIVERQPTFTRMAARPRTRGSCAIDCIVHQRQIVDLAIGAETYESLPARNVPLLTALFDATASGHVIARIWRHNQSAATIAVDTVFLHDEPASIAIAANAWELRRLIAGREARELVDVTAIDQHALPWQR